MKPARPYDASNLTPAELLGFGYSLRMALKELLEAFDMSDEDMDVWEYDAIVANAKANACRAGGRR
jgi:hypothetical protein